MNESLTVQVADKWLEAESVSVLELQGLDNEPLPVYQPGAHVDVFLRDGLCRQYSLSRYRPAPQKYQIAVLKESSSRGGSEWVHENFWVCLSVFYLLFLNFRAPIQNYHVMMILLILLFDIFGEPDDLD